MNHEHAYEPDNEVSEAPVGMAVMDALPVLCFSASMILVGQVCQSALFMIGAILCVAAELGKVLWKLMEEGISIGLANKYYELARMGDEMAAEHYRNLERHVGDCVQCGHCNMRCPFGFDQMRRMSEMAEYFGIWLDCMDAVWPSTASSCKRYASSRRDRGDDSHEF